METVEDVVRELLSVHALRAITEEGIKYYSNRIIAAHERGKWKYVKDGHEPLQHTHYIVGHVVQGENYCCEAYHRKAGSWYDDEGRQLQVYAFRELDEAPPMEKR